MGLEYNSVLFMLYAKLMGADFESTAMIGRQVMLLSARELRHGLVKMGYSFDEQTIKDLSPRSRRYAEDFLHCLGAREVHSFDASDYEGSTYVHDMNNPIPDEFKQRYSVICDGGALEHVFNFPMAIKNCMEMVRPGGYYLGLLPANNFMGHGFYQFSPELFFRLFIPENGFELVRLIAFKYLPFANWYRVKDPAEVKTRVTLISRRQVLLFVLAKRTEVVEPIRSWPQQSDYVSTWNQAQASGEAVPPHASAGGLLRRLRNLGSKNLPGPVKYWLILLWTNSILRPTFSSKFFEPLDPAADPGAIAGDRNFGLSR